MEKPKKAFCAVLFMFTVSALMPVSAFALDSFSRSLILFRSDTSGYFQLYTMRGDGTELTQLTSEYAEHSRARFSPDKSQIVYVRNDEKIYIMNADGTEKQYIANGSWADFTPCGRKLVISAYGGSSYAADNLFIYDLETAAKTALPSMTGSEYVTDVSASGRILYWHYFFFQVYYANIYSMNLDGTQNSQMTFYDDWSRGYARNPRFCPDETMVAYDRAEGSGYQQIRIMNADGTGDRHVISSLGQGAITPVWSPDGHHIIYADWVTNKSDIYIVNSDGTGREVFYDQQGNNYPLDWVFLSGLQAENVPEQVSVEKGQKSSFTFRLYDLAESQTNWTVQQGDNCPWITSITPESGILNGPDDTAEITVTVDTEGLESGGYSIDLVISDGTDSEQITTAMNVFVRVNLNEFVLLSNHWQADNCGTGTDCSAADWFVDGKIDLLDLMQLNISWLGEEMILDYPVIKDDFESGDFSVNPWQFSGNSNWTVTPQPIYSGNYSANSGSITHNQSTSLILTVDASELNTISFARKVSSESGYDKLKFFIDDIQQGDTWSGEKDWAVHTYRFTAGVHTFRWTYEKDGSVSRGSDCAWIDDIEIYFEEQ